MKIKITSSTYTLRARQFEDFDDYLAAAREAIAEKLGLELWQTDARWEDEGLEFIVVTVNGA